jgi:hypothetical protein
MKPGNLKSANYHQVYLNEYKYASIRCKACNQLFGYALFK